MCSSSAACRVTHGGLFETKWILNFLRFPLNLQEVCCFLLSVFPPLLYIYIVLTSLCRWMKDNMLDHLSLQRWRRHLALAFCSVSSVSGDCSCQQTERENGVKRGKRGWNGGSPLHLAVVRREMRREKTIRLVATVDWTEKYQSIVSHEQSEQIRMKKLVLGGKKFPYPIVHMAVLLSSLYI